MQESIPTNEKTTYQKRKGISIRQVNYILIAVVLLITALMIVSILQTTRSYESMRESTARYLDCRENATSLMDASDYLTESVREFVITGQEEPLYNFFREVNETRRRDIALESLGEYFDGTEAYRFLEAALKRSNSLAEKEGYAMRLAIEGRGGSVEDYPEELQVIALSPEDMALSAEEQSLKAIEMVFGTDYQAEKQGIRADVTMCLNTLINQTEETQAASSDHFSSLLHRQTALIVLLLVAMAAEVLLTFRLVINPLMTDIVHIRDQEKLPLTGASELRFLAKTYNSMVDQSRAHQEALSYEAEHDELTNLYNRGVFEKMREELPADSYTMILVDVDYFKEVNDTYGHDIGDRILRKVASMLQASFRSEDYVCRIGGDEFAVLMLHAGKNLHDLVERKMSDVNQKLQNPDDSLPSASLSIGVAFGDRDNPGDDIYRDADKALYQVKRSGRANIAFY